MSRQKLVALHAFQECTVDASIIQYFFTTVATQLQLLEIHAQRYFLSTDFAPNGTKNVYETVVI